MAEKERESKIINKKTFEKDTCRRHLLNENNQKRKTERKFQNEKLSCNSFSSSFISSFDWIS
jgi:hypothetical protein